MKRAAAIVILYSIFIAPALAQMELEAVTIVSAPRTNMYEDENLRNEQIDNLAQFLSYKVPLSIKNYGPGQLLTVSIHGLKPSHTLLTWKDFDLASAAIGQADFSLLPPCFFSQASADLSSIDAIGGEIELGSWPHKKSQITLSVGSFNTFKGCMALPFALKQNSSLEIKVYADESKNNYKYKDYFSPQQFSKLQHAGFHTNSIMVNYKMDKADGNTLAVDLWSLYKKRNLPPPLSYSGTGRTEYQEDFTNKLHLGFYTNKNLDFGFSWDSLHYFRADTVTGGNMWISNNSRSLVSETYLSGSVFRIKSLFLNFRFARQYFSFDDRNSLEYKTLKVSRTVGKILFQKSKCTKLKLCFSSEAGIKISDKNVFPVFRIEQQYISSGFFLGLVMLSTVKIPSLSALYWSPGGNPNLLPERSTGIDLFISKAGFKLNTYYKYVNNWIEWRPTTYHFWTVENYGTVHTYGFDLTFSKLWLLPSWQKLELFGTMSLNGVSTNFDKPIWQPCCSLRSNATYTKNNFKTGIEFNFEKQRKDGFYSLIPYTKPYFAVLDLTFEYNFEFDSWLFVSTLELNNIFGQDYQYVPYRPMPGQNFLLILTIKPQP